ncbi:MAG: protein kinase [Thermoguttaceae bacterium]|nr:protein kinase [Thermoguttaceae bacterium]
MSNELTSFAEYVHRWRKENSVRDPESLFEFVQAQADLSEDHRKALAIILITEDYRIQRQAGYPVYIEIQIEAFMTLFREKGYSLSEQELTWNLIQVDIEVTPFRLYQEDFIARFPLCVDLIEEYFKENANFLASRFGHLSEAVKGTSSAYAHKNGETLSLSEEYRILGHLGSGGQKDVYEVRQESTSQTLAMKELRDSNLSDESQKKAMTSEALLQARLSHPNIPIVLSLSNGGDKPPVFVERLIKGRNWLNVMWPTKFDNDPGPRQALSLDENLDILLSISRTLAYVHETHRIIHGDLKPENVMLGERGGRFNEIYLVDWGLAVSFESEEPVVVGGTMDYMPPEIYSAMLNPGIPASRFLSPATDVFMLGGILYMILTGKTPYEDTRYETGMSIRQCVEAGRYTPLLPSMALDPRTGKKIPEELIDIANKALSKEPKDRYANAEEFAESLMLYRKRAGLAERLEVAKDTLKQLQENAKPSVMALIESTNELRLIREAATDSDAKTLSSLSRHALQTEETARNLLLEMSLTSKDFGLTEAQLPVARQQIAFLEQFENHEPFIDQKTKLDNFEKRLHSGLAARRRERLLKWGLGAAACVIVLLSVFVTWYAQRNAQIARENANYALKNEAQQKKINQQLEHSIELNKKIQKQQSQIIEEKSNTQAKDIEGRIVVSNRHGQGDLVLLNQISQLQPGKQEIFSRVQDAAVTSLLPEQHSSFREIIDAITFSSDGKDFVALSPGGILTCWDTKSQVSRARIILNIPDNYSLYTEANPLFGKEGIAKHIAASPFILHSTYGTVKFLSDELSVQKEFNVLDVNDLSRDTIDQTTRSVITQTGIGNSLTLATIGNKGDVCYFALDDGKLLGSFQAQKTGLMSLAFSDNGQNVVTIGKNGSLDYRTVDGTLLQTLDIGFSNKHDSNSHLVRCCALSPSGKRIAAGNKNGEIIVWNIQEKKPIAKMNEPDIPGTLENFMNRFYWLDEERVLSLCLNNHYCLWNLSQIDKNLVPASLLMKSDQPNSLSGASAATFSRVNKQLLVAGNDHSLRLFDVETGKQLAKTVGLIRSRASMLTVTDAKYFQTADRILVGNFGLQSLYSIDPKTLQPDKIFEPYPNTTWEEVQAKKNLPCSIACPQHGTEFATAFCSGDIMMFDSTHSKPTHCFKSVFQQVDPRSGDCSLVAVSPSGKYLAATCIQSNEIILFDLKLRKELRRFSKTPKNANVKNSSEDKASAYVSAVRKMTAGLIFMNDETLFELTTDGTFKQWNMTEDKLVKSVEVGEANYDVMKSPVLLTSYELSHDKKHIALGFNDGYIKLIELKNLTTVYSSLILSLPISNYNGIARSKIDSLNTANAATGLAWSKDDSILVASFANGKTALMEMRYNTLFAATTSNDSAAIPGNFPALYPFFTLNDKIITLSSNGVFSRWDYQPSKEKATILKTVYGADTLCPLETSGQWAGVRDTGLRQFAFFVYENDKEKYKVEQVEDFRRFEPSADLRYFILLGKDGKLSVVSQKDGKPVDYPIITSAKNTPQNGFLRIEISHDWRYLAAIPNDETGQKKWYGSKYPGKTFYLLDLKESAPVWKLIQLDNKNPIVQLAISPDSKTIAAVDSTGILRVLSLDTRTERQHVDSLPLQGPMVACNQGRIRFVSDRFLAQCGASKSIVIWDINKMRAFQTIELNLFDRLVKEMNSVNGIASVPNLTGKQKAPAFVAAGMDGVLRFYQYKNEEEKFVSVYTHSSLKLTNLVRMPLLDKEPYLGYNKWRNIIASDVSNEKMKQDVAELKKLLGEKEFNEMESEIGNSADSEGNTDAGFFVRSPKNWVFDLALSGDGQTLYVGTSEEVRSYRMDEINRHIETLPQKWQNIDISALTGLIYRPGKGLYPQVENYMRKEQ